MKDNLIHSEPILTPHELQRQIPLTPAQESFVQQSRHAIREILRGKSSKQLVIIGPCSIHNTDEAMEFAERLIDLAERLTDRLFIVMRAYFEKPRSGVGWKGMIYDPKLDGTHQIQEGLFIARRFLIDLAKRQMPAATEFLDPVMPYYIGDLISWGCIGARTSASQIHRQMASSLSLPIGFKNSPDGDSATAINGTLAASVPQAFLGINPHGQISKLQSRGNPHCHVVLRGGEAGPNFDEASIAQVIRQLKAVNLTKRLLIDCSHDNSQKNPYRQSTVLQSVVEQVNKGNAHIAGFLLESYLCAGSQSLGSETLRYGISLTDSCLDWDSTEKLLNWTYERLSTGSPEPLYGKAYAERP